jgi:hypothetical protein
VYDAKLLLEPHAEIALARRGHARDCAALGELVERRADLRHDRDALRMEREARRRELLRVGER